MSSYSSSQNELGSVPPFLFFLKVHVKLKIILPRMFVSIQYSGFFVKSVLSTDVFPYGYGTPHVGCSCFNQFLEILFFCTDELPFSSFQSDWRKMVHNIFFSPQILLRYACPMDSCKKIARITHLSFT